MIVKIDDKAIKDLSKIHKNDAKKIFYKIENLEKFPQVPNLKKLTNFEPPYRLRVATIGYFLISKIICLQFIE